MSTLGSLQRSPQPPPSYLSNGEDSANAIVKLFQIVTTSLFSPDVSVEQYVK